MPTSTMFSVRLTGLEPARRETLDPKSNASTNSATGAILIAAFLRLRVQRYEKVSKIPNKIVFFLSLHYSRPLSRDSKC